MDSEIENKIIKELLAHNNTLEKDISRFLSQDAQNVELIDNLYAACHKLENQLAECDKKLNGISIEKDKMFNFIVWIFKQIPEENQNDFINTIEDPTYKTMSNFIIQFIIDQKAANFPFGEPTVPSPSLG
jgi:hypothetical protein